MRKEHALELELQPLSVTVVLKLAAAVALKLLP